MCVCLSVCLSVHSHMPMLLHRPRCNLGEWLGMPPSCALLGRFAVGARVALLWQCVAEPSGNAPGPPHALRMPAKTPAFCVRNVICNEAVPFRPYCGGVVTQTHVSEYMLVVTRCLVTIVVVELTTDLCADTWLESAAARPKLKLLPRTVKDPVNTVVHTERNASIFGTGKPRESSRE